MNYLQIIILSVIQGICELLPVSSSAHVIVASRLMGIDPVKPDVTFLIVMLHTGTMFAVIAYFWETWKRNYFASAESFWRTVKEVVIATVATGVVGYGLKFLIEKVFLHHHGDKAEVEQLFGNLPLIATALAAVGILIFIAGRTRLANETSETGTSDTALTPFQSAIIGVVQGLCLPFRGFSRSGATISTGLLSGVSRFAAERFSFALAVVLTPPVIAKEALRLIKWHKTDPAQTAGLSHMAVPGLLGMVCAFVAGFLALKWLSRWLETGRWQWFGIYCIIASIAVFVIQAIVPPLAQ